MSTSSRVFAALVILGVSLGASGCATAAPGGSTSDSVGSGVVSAPTPAPPNGEVMAQGTVMDTGTSIELCMGAIMESYPPQCRGITLAGWSWEGVDGSEESGSVRWGSYALQGTYDGTVFTLTQPPIMLALYDPIAIPQEPREPGGIDEETLLGIQEELTAALEGAQLTSFATDGRLFVSVVWDDGTLQGVVDEVYGPGVVIIESALREVAG